MVMSLSEEGGRRGDRTKRGTGGGCGSEGRQREQK